MFKKLILPLALFVTFHCSSIAQTEGADPSQPFASGDFAACISICDGILKANANDKKANFFKGAALVKLKKYASAKTYLLKAKENDYQPVIALNTNLLRVYAGLQETKLLLSSLQGLADNGYRALFVLKETEFEYLSADEAFLKLKTKVDTNANPCKYGEEYQRLDFWLGEWDVYVNDTKIGTSHITKSEGGCTLYEDYKTFSGFLGRSTNYYDPVDKKYTQIWIDKFNSITLFKEVESKEGYLQMAVEKKDGNLTRMTYVLDATSGHITQTMEASSDDGKTWSANFVGVYKRRSGESG